jgi:hypothetical protein
MYPFYLKFYKEFIIKSFKGILIIFGDLFMSIIYTKKVVDVHLK